MAAALDNSFAETAQPLRRASLPRGVRSGVSDRLAKA
jgi:hypothetical protein